MAIEKFLKDHAIQIRKIIGVIIILGGLYFSIQYVLIYENLLKGIGIGSLVTFMDLLRGIGIEGLVPLNKLLIDIAVFGLGTSISILVGTYFIVDDWKDRITQIRKSFGLIIIFAGFYFSIKYAVILGNSENTLMGLGIVGLGTFISMLIGTYFITNNWTLDDGEFRKSITIAVISVYFAMLALGGEIVIGDSVILKSLFTNFWWIVTAVIAFYFLSRTAEELKNPEVTVKTGIKTEETVKSEETVKTKVMNKTPGETIKTEEIVKTQETITSEETVKTGETVKTEEKLVALNVIKRGIGLIILLLGFYFTVRYTFTIQDPKNLLMGLGVVELGAVIAILIGAYFITDRVTLKNLRKSVGVILILGGFYFTVRYAFTGNPLVGLGVVGLGTFISMLIGTYFITDNWTLDDGEFRKSITIAVISVYFVMLTIGKIESNAILNSLFDNFWWVVTAVIAFYFGSKSLKTIIMKQPKPPGVEVEE